MVFSVYVLWRPISCYFYVSRGWKIDLKLVRLSDCVWPSSSSCSTTIIANSGLFCDPSFQSWEENFSYKKVLVQAQKRTIYCRSNCYALVTVVSLVLFLQKTPNHLKIYQFLMQLRHLPSKFRNVKIDFKTVGHDQRHQTNQCYCAHFFVLEVSKSGMFVVL